MKKIDWDNLGFNVVETRSMYKASCRIGEEWKLGGLIPYGTIELSPAAGVLNYGQGCFEGTKAYRTVKDRVVLFRPEMNAKRMALSTKRLCIPEMNQEFFLNAVKETLKDNIDYVPPYGKGSLYIRPIVWGTSPALGVKPVEVYTFMVFVSPVGPYFKGDIQPLKLKVSNKYHRAAPKGIGNAKAIGNYSASLLPLIEAKNSGFDEVIYLNAKDEEFVEEVGSANLFVLTGNTIKTPKLDGSILPGITRDAVITLAKDTIGLEVLETNVTLSELYDADEVFCTGTAVVVTPVGSITGLDGKHKIADGKMGQLTSKLRQLLTGIQRGDISDEFGWLYPIKE
jgi:branched-chain amino acid aminotransferase